MIVLKVCEPCREKLLAPNAPQVEGWTQLPPLCPECGAKAAQCVRILVGVEGAGVFTPPLRHAKRVAEGSTR